MQAFFCPLKVEMGLGPPVCRALSRGGYWLRKLLGRLSADGWGGDGCPADYLVSGVLALQPIGCWCKNTTSSRLTVVNMGL